MVPTISYMAYANEHLANNAGGAELLVYRVPIMQQQNMFLSEHREYGGSIYDTHTDGSGLCLSSRLRPILSIRPKYDHFLAQAPWQYPADLHLIYWLEKMGYEYDVITDEDVNYDGLARLENYNVVITGSHPEHNSGPQLDALHNYTQRGGRFMYMGADGWYWVHSYHPGYDGLGRGIVTEMRRCESGIRTWRADPGEYYHQGTGELGGMWRFRGRYLHTIAGTGMSSEGFDISTYYSRTPESNDARVAWAFEGIAYDEKLGNFGLVGGGAAGTELDIVDTMLGSPPHTLVVATSAGRHTEGYLLVMEDYGFNQQGLDGTQHPRVRSDIAYHETPNGGASFAFSSIAFCGALPWNNGDNNISTLVGNVLNRFMKDGPLPSPSPGGDHASRSCRLRPADEQGAKVARRRKPQEAAIARLRGRRLTGSEADDVGSSRYGLYRRRRRFSRSATLFGVPGPVRNGDGSSPSRLHVGVFQRLENEKVWTRDWVCIGTAPEIANPLDLLPYTIGQHAIHVQRSEHGGTDRPLQQGPARRLSRHSGTMPNRQEDQMFLHVMRLQPRPRV